MNEINPSFLLFIKPCDDSDVVILRNTKCIFFGVKKIMYLEINNLNIVFTKYAKINFGMVTIPLFGSVTKKEVLRLTDNVNYIYKRRL